MDKALYLIYWASLYKTNKSSVCLIDYLCGYEAFRNGDVFIPIFAREFHRALPMTKDFALFVLSKLDGDAKKACVIAPYHQLTEWEVRSANR